MRPCAAAHLFWIIYSLGFLIYAGALEEEAEGWGGEEDGQEEGQQTNWPELLADPGEARGCSTNTFVNNWLIDS